MLLEHACSIHTDFNVDDLIQRYLADLRLFTRCGRSNILAGLVLCRAITRRNDLEGLNAPHQVLLIS